MANLTSGITVVTVVTASGRVYVGTFLGIRHHDDACVPGQFFLYLQLTVSVSPYAIGEVIALSLFSVESIGPVTVPVA